MDEEHARFLQNNVWIPILKEKCQKMTPITMTWALKMKASRGVRV
jgi:hypothetical protein